MVNLYCEIIKVITNSKLKNVSDSVNENINCKILNVFENSKNPSMKYNCYGLLPNKLYRLTILPGNNEIRNIQNYDYLPASLKKIIITNEKQLFNKKISLMNFPNKLKYLSLLYVKIRKINIKNKLKLLVITEPCIDNIKGIINSGKVIAHLSNSAGNPKKISENMKMDVLDLHFDGAIYHENHMKIICNKVDTITIYLNDYIKSVELPNLINKLKIRQECGIVKYNLDTQMVENNYFHEQLFVMKDKSYFIIYKYIFIINLIINAWILTNINIMNNILLTMSICFHMWFATLGLYSIVSFQHHKIMQKNSDVPEKDVNKLMFKKLDTLSYIGLRIYLIIEYCRIELTNKICQNISENIVTNISIMRNIFLKNKQQNMWFCMVVFILFLLIYGLDPHILHKNIMLCNQACIYLNFVIMEMVMHDNYNIINNKLLLKNIPKSLKTIIGSREYKQLSQLKLNHDLNIEYDDYLFNA
jgi:hypothetical protein